MHHQRHRRARRQLLARRSGDGAEDARRVLQRRHRRPHRRGSIRPRAWSRASPACRFRATRRWSARTPSRTSRGIHQHGMLKHHSTYEIMRPEDVGLSRSHLVLGKHSGRHAFRERVQAARLRARRARVQPRVRGIQGARRQEEGAVRRRHRGAGAARRGLSARAPGRCSTCDIESRQRQRRRGARHACSTPTAATVERTASGDGPVDAAFKAIEAATGVSVSAAQVRGAQRHRGRGCAGRGASCTWSTISAAIAARASAPTSSSRARKAFLEVINRIELAQARRALARGAHAAPRACAQTAV